VRLPGKAELDSIAGQKFDQLVLDEIGRARRRITELEQKYPSADPREIAQRLIDSKKTLAGTSGAISGLFGLLSLPADLVVVTYLQTVLLVELATLYKANLKSQRGRDELLDLLGYANGVGPIVRAGPKLVGRIALTLFSRSGLPTLGRAFPVVAAPVTAYLNNRSLERVGAEGIRFYSRPKPPTGGNDESEATSE
jgi:hypothetical protein